MKKMFTLVLALGLLSSAFAQSGHKTVVVGTTRTVVVEHHDNNSRMMNDKSSQIRKINREFDQRINAVQSDRRLRRGEKNRQIRLLEKQRTEQINMVNARYAHIGRRY